jgi:hypothetical protein
MFRPVTEGPREPGQRAFDVQRLRQLFRQFAATQCHGRSLVYETLSEGVAGSDDLLDLLLATPDEQRRPALTFFASQAGGLGLRRGSRSPGDD